MTDMTFETAAPTLTPAQADRLEAVRLEIERLNAAVREAVQAGLAVELARASRHHSPAGCWGDQLRPVVARCR